MTRRERPKNFGNAQDNIEAIREGLGQFDGLLGGTLGNGLNAFVDAVGKLAEQGETSRKTGQFGDDKTSGVFGFHVKFGINGVESETFGDFAADDQASDDAPVVDAARTPLVDCFEDNDATTIIAELPGVAAGEVEVEAQSDSVSINTTGQRVYAKTVKLDRAVEPESLAYELTNGILEIKLKPAV